MENLTSNFSGLNFNEEKYSEPRNNKKCPPLVPSKQPNGKTQPQVCTDVILYLHLNENTRNSRYRCQEVVTSSRSVSLRTAKYWTPKSSTAKMSMPIWKLKIHTQTSQCQHRIIIKTSRINKDRQGGHCTVTEKIYHRVCWKWLIMIWKFWPYFFLLQMNYLSLLAPLVLRTVN